MDQLSEQNDVPFYEEIEKIDIKKGKFSIIISNKITEIIDPKIITLKKT